MNYKSEVLAVFLAALFIICSHSNEGFSSASSIKIKIDSKFYNHGDIYLAGRHAAILTHQFIEVWDFVRSEKKASLSFEHYALAIPDIDIKNIVSEIKLSWKERKEIEQTIKRMGVFNFNDISLSNDGTIVSLVQTDGSVYLWHTSDNSFTPLVPAQVDKTVVSPSGRYIGILYKGGTQFAAASIIDILNMKEIITIPSNYGLGGAVAFNNGEDIAYIGVSDFLLGLDLNSGEEVSRTKLLIGYNRRAEGAVPVSNDGRFIALNGMFVDIANGKSSRFTNRQVVFFNDYLIFDNHRSKSRYSKIPYNKFQELSEFGHPDRLAEVANVSIYDSTNTVQRGIVTGYDSHLYWFRLESELGSTVVTIRVDKMH